MRVIDAKWEKRNLGVNCTEIEVERGDLPDEIVKTIKATDSEYLVVKVPSGLTNLAFAVQEQGCRYIETNIRLSKKINKEPHLQGPYKVYEAAMGYHKATENELESVINEIRSGKIFKTDKVALDPYFSPELSGRRYALWTEDLMKSGQAKAYIVTYEEQNIGFIINVDKGLYVNAFLGGMLIEAQQSGLGLFTIGSIEKVVYAEGGKKILTGVSSNNLSVLRLYMTLNYDIVELTANYIRHS